MRVTVTIEQRFQRTPDGRIWAESGLAADFWSAYLEVFEEVRVVARIRDVAAPLGRVTRADAAGVAFEPVPYYTGPAGFVAALPATWNAVGGAAAGEGAYVLRVPSPIGSLVARRLRALGRPYGVEVVGDPYDVFAPGAVDHPLRPAFRWWFTRRLRAACAHACAASYVTERALQDRYPCRGPAYAISSIRLGPEAFAPGPRAYEARASRLVFVGSLDQLYKAPDVLLAAVAGLVAAGEDLSLTLIGEGRCRAALEASADARALGGRVRFVGFVAPGAAVRAELDRADVFVLPSRTEGLPRALIEAMARGLPCIGSSAGGIPELLAADALVRPGDVEDLQRRIRALVNDRASLQAASRANLARAGRYAASVLGPRRREFYEVVRRHAAAPAGRAA